MTKSQKTPENILIIELEKEDLKPLGTTQELRASILGLQANPGFEELLRRMRVYRSILRTRLEQSAEDGNRWELRALIQAYGFCERQLKQEIGRPTEMPREAYEEEQQEYERLAQFVKIIGRQAN